MDLVLKEIAGAALTPLSVIVSLLCIGVALLWFARARSVGRLLVTIALGALLLVGYGIPFDRIAAHLEGRYPALLEPDEATAPRWIVVLGGGVHPDETLPLSARLMGDTLYRLTEGVRLHRKIAGSKLLLLGAAVAGSHSGARTSAEVARALGVLPTAVVIEDRARDTAEEAYYVRQVIGDAPFLLVTSAVHMPRAVLLLERQGLRPLPAPTQHRVARHGGRLHASNFFPSLEHFATAHATAHELLGLGWAKLRGSRPWSAD